ncbi:hypothetical protein AB0D49_15815 [Streptomyces sp. NPDC048290]|uniref:hypothetical protein n=1 Tax=Streptomyces sp. NPDC048290 TaxID=3155811 RepID=UPI00342A9D6C
MSTEERSDHPDPEGHDAPGGPEDPEGGSEGQETPEAPPRDETADTADTTDDATDGPGDPEAPEVTAAAPRTASLPPSRPTRHRSLALITSVAAAVLLVGGGGLYLATSAGDGARDTDAGAPAGDGPGGPTPPPLALDGYGGNSGVAPGEPDPNGALYRVDGTLPKGPDAASVHHPSGDITAADVTRLAEALGIEGKPVAEGAAWRIGGQDGQGPSLSVGREAPGAWTFTGYAPGPDACQSATTCAKPPTGASVDPVGEAEAREVAAPVLKAVGQDDAKVDAGQVTGAQRTVNAVPVVGGLPTYGWNTQLMVGAQGELVGGNGHLGAPVKGASYPVVSAREALRLLNTTAGGGEVGIGGCAEPVPLDGTVPPDAVCAPATALPGKPVAEAVAVESAVFGLASHTVAGQPALVPSWLFEVRAAGAAESFTVTHPAVDPAYLAGASAAPSPESPPGGTPTRDVRVEGYTAEGRELTVRFTGGVCADYAVSVDESGGEVRVTVTETPWPDKICILIAEVKHQTVALDEPLGARKVVGSDGAAVALEKPGARLPR